MKKIAATALTLIAAFVLVSTAYAAGEGGTQAAPAQPAAAEQIAAPAEGPANYARRGGNATPHNTGCPRDGSCLVNGVCNYSGVPHNAGCPRDGSCLADGVCIYGGPHHNEGCPRDGSCLVDGVCIYGGPHHNEGGNGVHHNADCPRDGSCLVDGVCSYGGSHHGGQGNHRGGGHGHNR